MNASFDEMRVFRFQTEIRIWGLDNLEVLLFFFWLVNDNLEDLNSLVFFILYKTFTQRIVGDNFECTGNILKENPQKVM